MVAVLSLLSLPLASLLHVSPTFLSFPAPGPPTAGLGASPSSLSHSAVLKPTLPVPFQGSHLPEAPLLCVGDWGAQPGSENESQSNLPGDCIGHGGLCWWPLGKGVLAAERHGDRNGASPFSCLWTSCRALTDTGRWTKPTFSVVPGDELINSGITPTPEFALREKTHFLAIQETLNSFARHVQLMSRQLQPVLGRLPPCERPPRTPAFLRPWLPPSL